MAPPRKWRFSTRKKLSLPFQPDSRPLAPPPSLLGSLPAHKDVKFASVDEPSESETVQQLRSHRGTHPRLLDAFTTFVLGSVDPPRPRTQLLYVLLWILRERCVQALWACPLGRQSHIEVLTMSPLSLPCEKRRITSQNPSTEHTILLNYSWKALEYETIVCRAMTSVFCVLQKHFSDLRAKDLSLKKLNQEVTQ